MLADRSWPLLVAFSIPLLSCGGESSMMSTDRSVMPLYDGLHDETLLAAIRSDASKRTVFSYTKARKLMFTRVDAGAAGIEDVYTGRIVRAKGVPKAGKPHYMNAEHTWPQARLPDGSTASGDLHHLFPCDATANKHRADDFFGEVTQVDWTQGGSEDGRCLTGYRCFEPRDVHKGNAARAIFYMAAAYDLNVPVDEEVALRDWHRRDPPDDAERARNDRVAELQGYRNPFIDDPSLPDRVTDF